MKSVASRMRLARRAAGITQLNLAQALSVSRSAVAQWERLQGSNPGTANLAKVAIVLSCSFEWLATGRGNRHAGNKLNHPQEDLESVLRHFARSDDEDHLLSIFRELDEWDQRVVISLADALTNRAIYIRRKSKKK